MKHILTHTADDLLAKKFAYNNVDNFLKTKVLFLECKNIQEWFLKGYYDGVNSSLEFVQKFDFILDKDILNSFLKQNLLLKDKYIKLQEAKAMIKTNFKRKSEPLHVLIFISFVCA